MHGQTNIGLERLAMPPRSNADKKPLDALTLLNAAAESPGLAFAGFSALLGLEISIPTGTPNAANLIMLARVRHLLDLSDFATVPMAISALIMIAPPTDAFAFASMAIGGLAWTFAEYWVHRAMHVQALPIMPTLHLALRRAHINHHQHPSELPGGTLWSTLLILALFLGAISCLKLAAPTAGFFAGYLCFVVLHHAQHQGWPLSGSLVGRLVANHDTHHHAGPTRMYGVITPLWDRLFGTA